MEKVSEDGINHCFPKTGSQPLGGSREIFFFGSSRIMFPRSLQILSIDLGREGL